MKARLGIFFLVCTLLLSSCAAASATKEVTQRALDQGAPAMAPAMPEANFKSANFESAAAPAAPGELVNRIVIKNAELSIVVQDPADAMNSISEMAEKMGGFIVSSQLYKVTLEAGLEVPEANITVRVPADQLEEALNEIKALVDDPALDILNENVSGQDVTSEYTDLQSRLTNLENTAAKLKEIMASARDTQDVLAVYNELTRVNEQIEVLKGQIKYYDEASALSAINVHLQSKESVKPLTIGGWQPAGVARDAIQTLINALKFLANALIWVSLFCLPIGILIAVPGYFIFKGARRYWRNRKASKTTQPHDVETGK